MRIAIGGVATECCTFSPIQTDLQHFRIREGQQLLDTADYPFLVTTEAEIIPTIQARALPGGKVARTAYIALKERFLAQLKAALPLDGLYLDMHGAMNVDGLDDAEGDWYAAARAVVGPNCLISASYDLHGNLSERILANLDLLCAFRTAPHIDYLETRIKAFNMLTLCLQQGIRPHKVWIPVPVLLPGERTSTEYEPTASLYEALKTIDPLPGILDASILVGYVWADEPRATASIVVTGTELPVMTSAAEMLAQRYWDTRHDFGFSVAHGSIDEALDWAEAQKNKGLFISDSGDNPTAGGVGDRADFLGRLLERRVQNAILGGIADEAACSACYTAGEGEFVNVQLGGSLDNSSKPITVAGQVRFLKASEDLTERIAVLQVDALSIIISHKRRPFHHEADFLELGLDPKEAKMTIVKVGYLVPDLKRIAGGIYLALSPGVVDQDIPRLPYQRLARPMFPLEPDFDWQASIHISGGSA